MNEISYKKKVAMLSLSLGICTGFMAKHNILEEFKAAHPEVLKQLDKYVYEVESGGEIVE